MLQNFSLYYQRLPLPAGGSTRHTRDMECTPEEERPLDPKADLPLFRAQARVAFDLAERQLRGRRDRRAEIQHTILAGMLRAYWEMNPSKERKQVIYEVREWLKEKGKPISERTIEEAFRRAAAIGRPIMAK
jgi:hypothetical protein